MQATLTDLQRSGRRVMRPVFAGQTVVITEHGRPVARIVPEIETLTVSPEEFRRAKMSDAAILAAIDESRE